MLEKRAAERARGRHRLGHRRAHRLRLHAHRGHPRAPRRPGQPAWHLRPAPRRAHRQGERRGVDPAALPRPGPGQVLGLRQPAVRVRRDGLRVRLLGRAARRPRAVGGPVRRLLQRRPDHRRRVHLELGAEVGPALLGRPAPPPRLRGPGARPLLGPDRALPHDVRRGQHDGRLPLDPSVLLPSPASAGLCTPASPAHRLHPQVDAPAQGGEQRTRGLHPGQVPPGPPRPARLHERQGDEDPHRGGQGRLRPRGRAGEARRHRDRDPPARAVLPLPAADLAAALARHPGAEVVVVQDEPRNQGRGRSSRSTFPRPSRRRASTARSTSSRGRRRRPRPPAPRRSTRRSRPTSSPRRSTAERALDVPWPPDTPRPAGRAAVPARHAR